MGAARADDEAGLRLFEEKIHPVLAGVCFRCHGDQRDAGGLRVNSRAALLAGGDSGAALTPGNPDESLLLRAILRADDVSAMPPDKELTATQVEDFRAWISAGAPWPERTVTFASKQHWAFAPLRAVEPALPPANEARDSLGEVEVIDQLLMPQLAAAGRVVQGRADRRTLIRRATYDLTGLPPTAAEVQAFVDDPAPGAYEALIDHLLASPHYGEKWGRQWLDVVRYADTAGENSDHPLPHAWRYRNWVIGALNRDLPYDEFIRQQVAGDLLAADGPSEEFADRVVATGYLAIARRFGHDIDKDIHLTLEDTIDTLGKSVLGLTLGCCRCHDHKYDPLTTRDYYGLYGIFASTRFAYPGCEPQQQPRDLVSLESPAARTEREVQRAAQLAAIDKEFEAQVATQQEQGARLRTALAGAGRVLSTGQIEDGAAGDIAAGAPHDLSQVAVRRGEILYLAIGPRGHHGADTTAVEFQITEVDGERRVWSTADLVAEGALANPQSDRYGNAGCWTFLDVQDAPKLLAEQASAIEGHADLHGWRNGETPSVFVNAAEQSVNVWTSLPARRFFMHPGPAGGVALAWLSPIDGVVAVRGTIADAHAGGDGVSWQLMHCTAEGLPQTLDALAQAAPVVQRAQQRRAELSKNDQAGPVAYAVAEGVPQDARIQLRGDPQNLGDEAPRKFLDVLGGQAVTAKTGSGRLELAGWLTSPDNPLTARVIVNRVWQGHFGRGLVKTPNDFGLRGAPPTHPELLDYLAQEFIAGGWSLKQLHRTIMTSAAYQRASGAAADDSYATFARRRLTAEELRDTLLLVSGELDLQPGAEHPFPAQATWSFTQHGPFAADYDSWKRSVYVMQKRNRRGRFFTLFDGADPNASTPLRDVTTVPTQALYFMNDAFVHARSEKIAERVLAAAEDDASRVDVAYQQIFGRLAGTDERSEALALIAAYTAAAAGDNVAAAEVAQQAWAALARVMLASNEFLHVD